MPTLPTGTVTSLFTDITGSMRPGHRPGDRHANAVTRCRPFPRSAVQERGGRGVDTQGEASFCAFSGARGVVAAAFHGDDLGGPRPVPVPARGRC